MIVTEIINIDGRELTRAYSDAGYYIERDGAMYSEAVDPINSGRVYTETDVLIEKEEPLNDGDDLTDAFGV